MFGDGSQVRSFTHVDDVVSAAIATLDHDIEPGTVANIAGGATCSLTELVDTVEAVTGQPVPLDRRDAEAGDVERTDAVIERAQCLLDWSPRMKLTDGVADQVAWMRDHLDAATASS
jgi:UDP-glucuronate 4-epimerase